MPVEAGSSRQAGNLDFVLLTTKGRKTGVDRTVVVLSFEHDGDRLVVASASGARADERRAKRTIPVVRLVR